MGDVTPLVPRGANAGPATRTARGLVVGLEGIRSGLPIAPRLWPGRRLRSAIGCSFTGSRPPAHWVPRDKVSRRCDADSA